MSHNCSFTYRLRHANGSDYKMAPTIVGTPSGRGGPVGTTHSAPPPSNGSSPSSRSRSGSRLEEQRGRRKRTPSPQERGAAVGKASPVAPRRRRQGRGGCYRARCGYFSRPDRGGGDRDGSNSAPVSMEEAATVAVRPLLPLVRPEVMSLPANLPSG